MTPRPRLLSLEAAAELVGCHPETLRRAIKSRELLATRHPTAKGHPYRIDQMDLDAFLQKRRVQ